MTEITPASDLHLTPDEVLKLRETLAFFKIGTKVLGRIGKFLFWAVVGLGTLAAALTQIGTFSKQIGNHH